ncbi:MAG: peroxide stress protein YaaA [Aquificaceae bacterium]|nr:peroxide stress protein YaaA [Aquificaceae bacterium]MCX8059877.1 peroxide stress protein YaaA [Aquificaceae bacterium]MDW8097634.1 peroxide stress protein YaaA [Aquificaceae bacterium]
MLLFLLPYSKKQRSISFKNCTDGRFEIKELEPFARRVEGASSNSLAPLHRRFAGPFWESLELWALPTRVVEYIKEKTFVLSPVYGLLKPTACIPYLPVGWEEKHGEVKLLDLWRRVLRPFSRELLQGKVVLPLLPKAHLSLFDLSWAERVVKFEYYTKDQKVKNPYRHYAYTLRYVAERALEPEDFGRINFYDYRVEAIEHEGKVTLVRFRSEGRYEL